jgi:hypothetical protein
MSLGATSSTSLGNPDRRLDRPQRRERKTLMVKPDIKRLRNLSLEFFCAAFGYRFEIALVPFKLAKPQFALAPGMAREQRLPSLKLGPLHVWMMRASKWEIGFSADLQAFFHTHVFQRVYPNAVVWPDYKPRHHDRKE